MEEKVEGSGQEEQNADEPSLPGVSLVAQNQPQHRQEPFTQNQDLPIMHWEDLSLRIAELEKQEEERRKKAEVWQQSSVNPPFSGIIVFSYSVPFWSVLVFM